MPTSTSPEADVWERRHEPPQPEGDVWVPPDDRLPFAGPAGAPGGAIVWIAVAKACALTAGLLLAGFLVVTMLVGAGVVDLGGGCSATLPPGGGIPATLVPIYEQAATRYALGSAGAAVLAAINRIETDFGRDTSTSSAGAVGFMQFMPATWATYGVDANGDGTSDPRDPWDAIFAAANYLRANGAPGDWHRAVFAYNHADWYVNDVLGHARSYAGGGWSAVSSSLGCAPAAPGGTTLARIITEAGRIDALRLPYVYGGGHVTPAPANGPFDCSSAWSRLLQAAGYDLATITSTGFMTWGAPGPGRYVTIYATPAHVYGTILGRAWGTSGANPRDPAGGPAWLPYVTNPLPGFPDGTPTVRHPPGL